VDFNKVYNFMNMPPEAEEMMRKLYDSGLLGAAVPGLGSLTGGGLGGMGLVGKGIEAVGGPKLDMSKGFGAGLAAKGIDQLKGSGPSAGMSGAGMGMEALGGLMPGKGPMSTLAKTGLAVGAGLATGNPIAAGVGGGMTLLSGLMSGKDGQQQKVAVPQMSTQMGQIGDIYG
jgi:hypothetical protein